MHLVNALDYVLSPVALLPDILAPFFYVLSHCLRPPSSDDGDRGLSYNCIRYTGSLHLA